MNPSLARELLKCTEIQQCITLLEREVKQATSFDKVDISIFNDERTMTCLGKNSKHESIINEPSHYAFNCMLYNLKEQTPSVLDKQVLKERNIKCRLVDRCNLTIAFAELITNNGEKIGLISGYNKEGEAPRKEQKDLLIAYAKQYANIIDMFKRLDTKQDKISHLQFLTEIQTSLPEHSDISQIIKQFMQLITDTFDFD